MTSTAGGPPAGPERRRTSDRVAGAVLAAVALAIALQARTFEVGFLTDPVGPKALPWLVAGILGMGGVLLFLRPAPDPAWPTPGVWARIVLAVVSLAAYALILSPVGFLLSTTLEVVALSLLFGGPWLRSALAAAAFTGTLWVLFVHVLGIPLPVGTLWLASGG